MTCRSCKKDRDLDTQGLCKVCSLSGRDVEQIVHDHKRAETVRRLRQEISGLVRDLKIARDRADFIDSISTADRARSIERAEIASGLREGCLVVHLSDWHIGEIVEPEKVNGLNAFDLEVADLRIARIEHAIPWLVEMYRSRFELRSCVIVLGGDLMTGYIHEELVEGNSLSPTEEVLWLIPRLERIILGVAEGLDMARVSVMTNFGNHGRTTNRLRISTGAENSFEWLAYQILVHRFKDHPVIDMPSTRSSEVHHEVFGRTIRAIHGDELSFHGGVGGLSIPLAKLIHRLDVARRADLTMVDHWHQYTPGASWIVNGSLKGFDAYAQKRGFAFELPLQSTCIVDSRHGICLQTPIWLDHGVDRE